MLGVVVPVPGRELTVELIFDTLVTSASVPGFETVIVPSIPALEYSAHFEVDLWIFNIEFNKFFFDFGIL